MAPAARGSDADGASATQNSFEDEFVLDDARSSSTSSSRGGAGRLTRPLTAVPVAAQDASLSQQLHRAAFTGLNVLVSCSALAVAKQILNPANFARSEAQAEAAKALPAWYQRQYQSRRMASDFTRKVLKDTGALVAASAVWYGVQIGMKSVRGADDAVNPCTAGALSAGLLGAVFIEPFKATRPLLWGAVGGVAGYFGYQEQQVLRAALLEKQQQLEQKHLHTAPSEVHTALDSKLLKRLLEMEQQEQLDQLAAKMQRHGVDTGRGGGSGSSGGGGGGGGGGSDGGEQQQGQQQLQGQQQGQGQQTDDWQGLMSAAPWLDPPARPPSSSRA